MRLAITNQITAITVSGDINTSFGGSDGANLLGYTFDKNYQSGGANSSLFFEFEIPVNDAQYIGISGHNFGDIPVTITIKIEGSNRITSFTPTTNRPLFFAIPYDITYENFQTSTSDDFLTSDSGVLQVPNVNIGTTVRVEITKSSGAVAILSHIACGQLTDLSYTMPVTGQLIESDFKGGYPRIPMTVSRKSKTTVNDQAAPMATIIQTVSQRVSLSLDNVPTEFAQVLLVDYQNFWVNNGFFIQDITEGSDPAKGLGEPDSSYVAFNFMPRPPKSHNSTRKLVNLIYQYTAHNGL